MLLSQGLSNNPHPEQNQSKSIQIIHTRISLRSLLILYSDLQLGFLRNFYPVKILKALLPSSILATCPAQHNLLDWIIWLLEVNGTNYEDPHLLKWSFLQSTLSFLLTPNTRLRILLSNTLSLCSSLNLLDYISQPHSTTGHITV